MINDKMTDEELVVIAQNSKNSEHNQAQDELVKRYRKLVALKASNRRFAGAGYDDVIQEGNIGLLNAIRTYKADMGAKFNTFANCCVTRRLLLAMTAANRKKRLVLGFAVSLDDNKKVEVLVEKGAMPTAPSPEEELIQEEDKKALLKKMDQVLSKMEKKVFKYHTQGLSYKQIAKKMDMTEKSVDNAFQRARRKLKD